MVVESNGRLRLARNAAYGSGSVEVGTGEQWIALDTGKALDAVSLVGMAVGIVVAVL